MWEVRGIMGGGDGLSGARCLRKRVVRRSGQRPRRWKHRSQLQVQAEQDQAHHRANDKIDSNAFFPAANLRVTLERWLGFLPAMRAYDHSVRNRRVARKFWCAAFAAIACFCTMKTSGFALVDAQDDHPVKIVHEKDLSADPKTGYGAFAWRPDSKAIAYVKWLGGRIGVLDVATGAEFEIPGFQMNGIQVLAWSADGGMLALNSHTQLKIVRMSDYQVISAFDFYRDKSEAALSINQMAFTSDGKTLIFENTNDHGKALNRAPPSFVPVILYSYDIETGRMIPLLSSPFGERQTGLSFLNPSEFQRHDGKLFYAAMIQRFGERLDSGSHIVNNIEYRNSATPSTCVVYEFDDSGTVTSKRSIDFPKPGEELLDQSRDIFGCRYSATANMLAVVRRDPYRFDADPPIDMAKLGSFVETFDLNSGTRAAVIGREPGLESNRIGFCLPHPTQPWCLTESKTNPLRPISPGGSLGEDAQFLRLWDMRSGQEIAQTQLSHVRPKLEALFSPDGTKIAFREASNSMPIFNIVMPKGGSQ
jgi:WD40 repeat protein